MYLAYFLTDISKRLPTKSSYGIDKTIGTFDFIEAVCGTDFFQQD